MHVDPFELPPEAFPVRIEALAMATGAKVWETTVTRPDETDALTQVASLLQEHGALRFLVTYGYDEQREQAHLNSADGAN